MMQIGETLRVEKNPNESVPLVAIVYFSADVPVSTTIEINDGNKKRDFTYGPDKNPAEGLPIIGMRADTKPVSYTHLTLPTILLV